MTGIGPLEIIVLLVLLLLEVGIFWAAASLGDAPPLAAGKIVVVGLLVGLLCLAATVGAAWGTLKVTGPYGLESWVTAVLAVLACLAVTWLVSAILYVPLLPVPAGRSMLIALVQILLRAFLYVLLAGVVFVVLAGVQILTRRTSERPVLPVPVTSHSVLA